ncbi:MAG TPA: ATP-binding protein [Gaiellales bacterium]|jgi:heavy metal sensor kinase
MRLPIPIRLRLALVSAALAAAVLAAGLLTVYLIEAHQVHQTLVTDARAAAHDLALAGEHTGRTRSSKPPKSHTPPATQTKKHKKTPAGGASTGVIIPPPVTGSGDSAQTGGTTTWAPPASAGGGESGDGGGSGWGGSSGGGESGDSMAGPGAGRADVAFQIPAAPASPATAEADDATETEALKTYLGARSGSDQLLLYIPAHGKTLGNSRAATRLAELGGVIPGSVRTVTLDGDGYVVATAARGTGIVMAGVPVAEADAGVSRLLDAMLIVGLIGLVPATALAWLIARRALSPLSRIAQRASRVTAGDLSVRMGPVTTRDEIGEVATAIDAMLDRLEVAFAAQRQFVHDASHELRTPLTIARGHLEVALPGDDGSPELRQAVAVAIGELDRMGQLVDSLLRLARAGVRERSDRTAVDVAVLARTTVERCRVLGERTWGLQTTPEAYVDGDEGALEQVLLNLLSNAVRHTVAGDSISVSAIADGDRVRIEVADTGEGIDPDLLPSLFDRFTRADTARSRDTGGAGLGLAICHAIVEAHGGTIAAESPPGEGARFVVDLPRAHPQQGNGHVRAVSPPLHV